MTVILLGCVMLAALAFVPGVVGNAPGADSSDAAQATAPAKAEAVVFYDSFESASMDKVGEEGFKWLNPNRTSIVTMDEQGPVVVWNNKPISNRPSDARDWHAKTGDHAMRFRYPAGNPMAEQRFDLGKAYPEIWIRYWLRVPTNFRHTPRSEGSQPSNHKLFAIWMDGYEVHGEGPTTTFQFWAGDDGVSSLTMYHFKERDGAGNRSRVPEFIVAERDRGRWMQLIFHTKMSSAPDTRDGFMRVYRRWENEDAFKKVAESKDKGFHAPEGGPNGWSAGYLMGWANTPYKQNTEWLLDDFTVSTQSLLDIDGDGQDDAAAAQADAGD